MKIRILTSSLLPALFFAVPFLHAQDMGAAPAAPAASASDAAAPAQSASPSDDDKTDLEKKMTIISKAMKKLKGQIKDSASNASSLDLVSQIHDAAQAAVDMTPKKEKDLPDADQAKFHSEYQQGLKDFIGQVDQLTDALKADDNDKAAKIYAQLGQTERKDHKKFKKQEKKDS